MPKRLKLDFQSKNHSIFIAGPNVPEEASENFAKLQNYYYTHENCEFIRIDNDGTSFYEHLRSVVPEYLTNKSNKLRIDISVHGEIRNPDTDKYQGDGLFVLTNSSGDFTHINEVLKVIRSIIPANSYQIHLWTCYAGAATIDHAYCPDDVMKFLPYGSVFIAHGAFFHDARSENLYLAQLESIYRNPNPCKLNIILPSDAIEGLSIISHRSSFHIQHLNIIRDTFEARAILIEKAKILSGVNFDCDFPINCGLSRDEDTYMKFIESSNETYVLFHNGDFYPQDLIGETNSNPLDYEF